MANSKGPSTVKWNTDPDWVAYAKTFEDIIQKVVSKYADDSEIRQDCAQNARMGLLTVFPTRLRGWKKYQSGEYSEEQWLATLEGYCRNVIRNQILSTLSSNTEGDLYRSRTRNYTDPETGEQKRRQIHPRFYSLDKMVSDDGLQVDAQGRFSWEHVAIGEDDYE